MERNGIKAETWVAAHHPHQKEWIARQKGIFSRNYADDLRSCDPQASSVELSRDGLYEVLPDALFFKGNELQGINQTDFEWVDRVLQQRRDRIKTVLLPFDSSYFNHSLALEREVNGTIAKKTELLLQTFVGDGFADESNPYIRKMAPMLLQAARLRETTRHSAGSSPVSWAKRPNASRKATESVLWSTVPVWTATPS